MSYKLPAKSIDSLKTRTTDSNFSVRINYSSDIPFFDIFSLASIYGWISKVDLSLSNGKVSCLIFTYFNEQDMTDSLELDGYQKSSWKSPLSVKKFTLSSQRNLVLSTIMNDELASKLNPLDCHIVRITNIEEPNKHSVQSWKDYFIEKSISGTFVAFSYVKSDSIFRDEKFSEKSVLTDTFNGNSHSNSNSNSGFNSNSNSNFNSNLNSNFNSNSNSNFNSNSNSNSGFNSNSNSNFNSNSNSNFNSNSNSNFNSNSNSNSGFNSNSNSNFNSNSNSNFNSNSNSNNSGKYDILLFVQNAQEKAHFLQMKNCQIEGNEIKIENFHIPKNKKLICSKNMIYTETKNEVVKTLAKGKYECDIWFDQFCSIFGPTLKSSLPEVTNKNDFAQLMRNIYENIPPSARPCYMLPNQQFPFV